MALQPKSNLGFSAQHGGQEPASRILHCIARSLSGTGAPGVSRLAGDAGRRPTTPVPLRVAVWCPATFLPWHWRCYRADALEYSLPHRRDRRGLTLLRRGEGVGREDERYAAAWMRGQWFLQGRFQASPLRRRTRSHVLLPANILPLHSFRAQSARLTSCHPNNGNATGWGSPHWISFISLPRVPESVLDPQNDKRI